MGKNKQGSQCLIPGKWGNTSCAHWILLLPKNPVLLCMIPPLLTELLCGFGCSALPVLTKLIYSCSEHRPCFDIWGILIYNYWMDCGNAKFPERCGLWKQCWNIIKSSRDRTRSLDSNKGIWALGYQQTLLLFRAKVKEEVLKKSGFHIQNHTGHCDDRQTTQGADQTLWKMSLAKG